MNFIFVDIIVVGLFRVSPVFVCEWFGLAR